MGLVGFGAYSPSLEITIRAPLVSVNEKLYKNSQRPQKKRPAGVGEAWCRDGSGLLLGHGAAVVQVWCRMGSNWLKLLVMPFLTDRNGFLS